MLRLPVEGLLLVALGLVLPRSARRVVATVFGLALGLLAILKIVDMGFFSVLGQPFNPLTDWSYLRSAVGVLRDSAGPIRTVAAVVAAILVLVAVLLLVTWSALRLTRFTSSASRFLSLDGVRARGRLAALRRPRSPGGGRTGRRPPPPPHSPTKKPTPALAADDAFAAAPGAELLTGLRGKDVLIVFVESYGRVAIEDPAVSPEVNEVLTRGTDSLRAAGFSSRSAFLTSPTFAGISWLAHGTLQSGLWIDSQQRYNQLVQTDRLTLSAAFKRAGWRTVAAVPSNTEDWPEGTSFYHYDAIYDRRNVGYCRPELQLRLDARPVHARRLSAQRVGAEATTPP